MFKRRVYNIHKQSWEAELPDSSRATFYCVIKDMHTKSDLMGIENIVYSFLAIRKQVSIVSLLKLGEGPAMLGEMVSYVEIHYL